MVKMCESFVFFYLEQQFWAVAHCFPLLGRLQGSSQRLETVGDLIIIKQFLTFLLMIYPAVNTWPHLEGYLVTVRLLPAESLDVSGQQLDLFLHVVAGHSLVSK